MQLRLVWPPEGPRTSIRNEDDMENRFSPSPADQRNQATLRHPERSAYRCFLTDLAGFTDICRVGPDYADRQDRKKIGPFQGKSPSFWNAFILLLFKQIVNHFQTDIGSEMGVQGA